MKKTPFVILMALLLFKPKIQLYASVLEYFSLAIKIPQHRTDKIYSPTLQLSTPFPKLFTVGQVALRFYPFVLFQSIFWHQTNCQTYPLTSRRPLHMNALYHYVVLGPMSLKLHFSRIYKVSFARVWVWVEFTYLNSPTHNTLSKVT